MGKGHLSLGKTVEPGRGGEGSFVSRKTVQGEVGKGHLSLGTMILTVEPGRKREGGHLSLGTMILTVEPGRGRGGVICQ